MCRKGRRVGTWALDVDSPENHAGNGLAEWAKLEREHGGVGTRSHLTGTKGQHLFFLWDPPIPVGCPTKTVPEGMEVKGESGYVIFPPSPYQLKGQTVQYDVLADWTPEEAPGWLYNLVLGRRANKGNGFAGASGQSPIGQWPDGYGRMKLDEICEIIKTAGKGEWDAAGDPAHEMGRLCAGGAYNSDEALGELLKAARENLHNPPRDYYDDRDSNPGKIKRAFQNGLKAPASPNRGI